MNKQEKNKLKEQIQFENIMVRRIGKWLKVTGFIFTVSALIAYWGFANFSDPWIKISDSTMGILKWIALIVAIIALIFEILCFLSHHNGKKHVLQLIERLEKK